MQQEMEYVQRVWEEKSFTKAAEKLYLSQPALSMAIRKVEDSLGMPIFDRSIRPMGLTPAGEAYLEYIKHTQFLEQEMQQRMQDIREVRTGSVCIGGSHYINAYILPDILAGFMREYPFVKIDMIERSSAKLSEMLANREVDVIFNCNPKFMLDFERYPAFLDHILMAVPTTFAVNQGLEYACLTAADVLAQRHLQPDCPSVPLRTFQYIDFILLQSGNNLYDRAKQLFQEAGFTPRIKLEHPQLVTAYRLANAGIGATFVSDRLVGGEMQNLFYYKLDTALANRMFYMLLPERKYCSQAVRAFVNFCTNAFSQSRNTPADRFNGAVGN